MFETLSWFYRYVFLFFLLSFFIFSSLIFFRNKIYLQPFLPVIIILMNASSLILLSMNEGVIRNTALYILLAFFTVYIATRLSLKKILKIKNFFDVRYSYMHCSL